MNDFVRQWQRLIGVPDDGIFGPATLAASIKAQGAPKPPAEAPPQNLPWVAEMQSVLGLHESRDKARLQAWLKSDRKTLGDPTALPWCGDAMETAMKNGLPSEPFPGALGQNPYWARNWALLGREVPPTYGAIGVFERGPTSGHVGILVGEDATCFHVLGGNQGDSVSVTRILRTRLLAARWPSTWASQPKLLPRLSASLQQSTSEA
jgi:uncharacterized protein (TIGR02594 family)